MVVRNFYLLLFYLNNNDCICIYYDMLLDSNYRIVLIVLSIEQETLNTVYSSIYCRFKRIPHIARSFITNANM